MSDKKINNKFLSWLEINLDNLSFNFREIKKIVSPQTKILVCIKKDAYGHGMIPVAKKLIKEGVDFFGVASIKEATILREKDISVPILILGTSNPVDIEPIIKYDFRQSISNYELALALNRKASIFNKKINIHIEIDTGMGRTGVVYKEAIDFIKKILHLKYLNIEGIFTHFPLAEKDSNFTLKQIHYFKEIKQRLIQENIHVPLYHAANSAALVCYRESHFDMVRPGLIIYGVYPKRGLNLKLKPVLTLKSRIILIKKIPKGWGISYGHTYRTKKDTNIVVIPIGYGDGYPRALSNRADVLIRGRRFRISGTICMDQLMVDVGGFNYRIGEEVVLIGNQGKESIPVEELAKLSETIPYEILTSLGAHLPHLYIEDKNLSIGE